MFVLNLILSLIFSLPPLVFQPQVLPTFTPAGFPDIRITSPQSGQVLQGLVIVLGKSQITDFSSYEIEFAYQEDTTGTWFLLITSDQPVNHDTLIQWDTSTITDGTYKLRLTVTRKGGQQFQVYQENLRVRNYSAIETNLPIPHKPSLQITPSQTPVKTVSPPTPTPLPPNPAQLTRQQIQSSITRGALMVVAFFLVIAVYRILRTFFTR